MENIINQFGIKEEQNENKVVKHKEPINVESPNIFGNMIYDEVKKNSNKLKITPVENGYIVKAGSEKHIFEFGKLKEMLQFIEEYYK